MSADQNSSQRDWHSWPNGVPYIDEDTCKENLNDPATLRELIAYLWLYIGRYEETKLTTEQKELLADVVEGTPDAADDFKYDRWWQRDDA